MLRCYELAHLVGISKTTNVPATPRCLEWRHDLSRTSTTNDQSHSDSQDPCRRPGCRLGGNRRPRLPVAGVLVVDGRITTHRRPSPCLTFAERVSACLAPDDVQPVTAPWCAWRGRRCRPRRHDRLR